MTRRMIAFGGLKAITGVVWLVAGLLALGLLGMTLANRAHNEQMYVAAGYLLSQGQRLYTDFAFVQMPYMPWVYAAVYSVTGASYYLLKAKLVTWACLAGAGWLLTARSQRAGGDTLFAATLLTLFLANYYTIKAVEEASNYALPLLLGLVAYVVFLRGVEGRMRLSLAAGLAGLALGGAVGTKLYYAMLALPFGLVALRYPRELPFVRRLAQGVGGLALGGLVGLGPVAVYALGDWDRFAFNNLGYHVLNAQWRLQSGFTDGMTLGSKLDMARDLAINPNYLVLELWLAVALLLVGMWRPTAGTLLAAGCSLTALVTAFVPSPLFSQYFAMPVPFLALWMAELYGGADAAARRLLTRLALVCAVAAILVVLPRHTAALTRLVTPNDSWAGIVSVADSRAIRDALDEAGAFDPTEPLRVATLSPVAALETHLAFYPELATGSFVYRIGDLLTPEQRAAYVATSPGTLAALLDARPPSAILIGDEGDAEIPLREYAEQHGFRRVEVALDAGELWVR